MIATAQMIGDILWNPPADLRQTTEIGRYLEWLRAERNLDFSDYDALQRWSTSATLICPAPSLTPSSSSSTM